MTRAARQQRQRRHQSGSSAGGVAILFGDEGSDFITTTTTAAEVFAGEAMTSFWMARARTGLMVNEGDDWIEGGEGFDGLSGENSDLFFNSAIIGHDVLWGQGNDTDYDGESGDDIMVMATASTAPTACSALTGRPTRAKSQSQAAAGNLLATPSTSHRASSTAQTGLTIRDRWTRLKGLRRKFNDRSSDNSPTGAVGGVAGLVVAATDSMLLSQNLSLTRNLETLVKLTPGALRGQTVGTDADPFSALAKDTTVFNPQTGGDILLGGAGSDRSSVRPATTSSMAIAAERSHRGPCHQDCTGALVTNLASGGTDGSSTAWPRSERT